MRVSAILLFIPLAAFGGQTSLSKGEQLYQQADYQGSIAAVRRDGQASAAAAELVGRDYYMLGDFKNAGKAFARALTLEPRNSEAAHWLGKSFARRAEEASLFAGSKDAAAARTFLEKAVALDPNNRDALNDLFDYYLEAPGFRGRGYDRAEMIAHQIAARNPAEGKFEEARLAERRKEYDTPQEQVRRLIQVTPHQVDRILDLARNLALHGQIPASEAAFDRAERLAPNSLKVALARAQVYVQQRRNLDRAKALLTRCLRSDPKPGDPSRALAQELLKEATGA